jgi:CubicO group peptidase (beta-lactamase class C family)
MASSPGREAVYCSANAILAGGMLRKISGEPLPELFDRLIARPLQMSTYRLNLTLAGELYTAGGGYFRPRDYMKLAQVMLNGGTWHGKRIISRAWVQKSSASLYDLTPRQQYGYFWNTSNYDFKGRKIRAIFAAGNGSQIFLEIPTSIWWSRSSSTEMSSAPSFLETSGLI